MFAQIRSIPEGQAGHRKLKLAAEDTHLEVLVRGYVG